MTDIFVRRAGAAYIQLLLTATLAAGQIPPTPPVTLRESISVWPEEFVVQYKSGDGDTSFGLGAYRDAPGITNPVPIRKPSPPYTAAAMRNGIEGAVDLEAIVRADGTVGDVRILRSLDREFGMDREAVKAAKQWLFTPAKDRSGAAVPMIVVIGFDLRNHSSPAPVPVTGPKGANIKPPTRIRQTLPVYPAAAHAAGVQGVVIVEAITNNDGDVVFTRVVRSVPVLDEAALEAVRTWRYTPTILNGAPTATLVTATIDFSIPK